MSQQNSISEESKSPTFNLSSESDDSKKEEEEEDEIDMDDPETECIRQEALRNLSSIEETFQRLKQALYEERMQVINQEEEKLISGTHPDYQNRVQEIEQRYLRRRKANEAKRLYALDSAHVLFEAQKHYFESEFCEFRFKSRIRRIEDSTRMYLRRNSKRIRLQKTKRRVTKSFADDLRQVQEQIGYPCLRMQWLSNEEVEQDLCLIKTL